MNIFDKAILNAKKQTNSNCYICNKEFKPDNRNIKRGWGLFCSKSCSTIWRNKEKTTAMLRDYSLRKLGI